jgi:hypothetical protein
MALPSLAPEYPMDGAQAAAATVFTAGAGIAGMPI